MPGVSPIPRRCPVTRKRHPLVQRSTDDLVGYVMQAIVILTCVVAVSVILFTAWL